MRTRKLADIELTTVGLGTWAIGGPWQFGWGPQDDNDSIATILKAVEEGVNWIDTAPIYGCGHSEEIVGKAIRQIKDKPFIATKCGLLWDSERRKVNCLKRKSVRQECHDSLRRLGVDRIDLYQMHWPEPDEDIEQAWEEMAGLVEEGKVRYIGVCNCDAEHIGRMQKIHPVCSLQSSYSMLNRQMEDGLLDYCAGRNISFLAYSPMQMGLLTGKFTPKHLVELPSDDHRRGNPYFCEPLFAAALELVEQLRPIAERNRINPAQLAIGWVIRRPEVVAAIVGARRPEQIEQTVRASDIVISSEDIKEIEQLLFKYREKINVKQ